MNELKKIVNHYTIEEKQKLCEQWKISGKTKSQFCKEHGIALATFYGWCTNFLPSSKKEKTNLLPIKIVNEKKIVKRDDIETTLEIKITSQMLVCLRLPVKNVVGFIQELANAVAIIR